MGGALALVQGRGQGRPDPGSDERDDVAFADRHAAASVDEWAGVAPSSCMGTR